MPEKIQGPDQQQIPRTDQISEVAKYSRLLMLNLQETAPDTRHFGLRIDAAHPSDSFVLLTTPLVTEISGEHDNPEGVYMRDTYPIVTPDGLKAVHMDKLVTSEKVEDVKAENFLRQTLSKQSDGVLKFVKNQVQGYFRDQYGPWIKIGTMKIGLPPNPPRPEQFYLSDKLPPEVFIEAFAQSFWGSYKENQRTLDHLTYFDQVITRVAELARKISK